LVGTNPKVVQDLLGHSAIRLTLDTYSHIMPKMQDETAECMNQLLGSN
jgi:integrase